MNATKKMDAFGLKALAAAVGVDLVTVYRWRRALLEGDGISTKNQRRLVEATAGSENAIRYADFLPPEPEGGAAVTAGAGA